MVSLHANKCMTGSCVAYLTATNLQDALAVLADGARPIAGGTDLYPALGARPLRSDLVDLSRIEVLRGISRDGAGWRIGAATSWHAIAQASLPPALACLQQAAREVGAIQIQQAGTIGGNLANASPAADGVPPLLVLEAEVELRSLAGVRRLKLAEFLRGPGQTVLAPGELITAVILPEPPEAQSAFLKLGSRAYLVISYVMAAALIELEGDRIRTARVAVGACSPVAQRLAQLEADLAGQKVAVLGAPGLVEPAHLTPLSPIDDLRADAAYRQEAAGELVVRALARAAEVADV